MNELKFYEIPKVFFDRYIYSLSSDAFCVLLRFYRFYLDHYQDEKDIDVPFSVFKKQIATIDDLDASELVWAELDLCNLVKRYYKYNIYELVLSQINADNNDDKRRRFKIHLIGKIANKIRRKKGIQQVIKNFLDRSAARYSNERIKEKYKKMLDGTLEYLIQKKGKVELSDVDFLIKHLIEIPDQLLEKICDIYNEVHFAQKPPQYILGILRNLQKEIGKDESIKKIKFDSLDKYKKEKEESDKRLGLKIALGKIDGNAAYQAHINLKDFVHLKQLYEIGVNELKIQKRENEIFTDYDWLKNVK